MCVCSKGMSQSCEVKAVQTAATKEKAVGKGCPNSSKECDKAVCKGASNSSKRKGP